MSKIKEEELALNSNDLWLDAWERLTTRQIASTGQETTLWRAGGRATKENPNKEDGTWWAKHGAGMVQNWIDWREQSHGMELWVTPQGQPAIELVLNIELEGVPVKMALDRLMVTQTGELVVVDLKTGKNVPKSSFQLGMYAVGMEITFGVRPRFGTYWGARDGVTTELIELNQWTIERAGSIVKMFDTARKSGIFVPNFDHCNMCNYTAVCKYKDGDM